MIDKLKQIESYDHESLGSCFMAINDSMHMINGKWRIPILFALSIRKKRFKELQRELNGITPRMLSRDLMELEMNFIVRRTVHHQRPVIVEYELTEYAHTLKKIIEELYLWGVDHRKKLRSE